MLLGRLHFDLCLAQRQDGVSGPGLELDRVGSTGVETLERIGGARIGRWGIAINHAPPELAGQSQKMGNCRVVTLDAKEAQLPSAEQDSEVRVGQTGHAE